MSDRFAGLPVIIALYALISLPVLCVWLTAPGIDGFSRAKYIPIVYGKASKPFVLRVFTPFLIRGLSSVIRPWINKEAANEAFDVVLAGLKKSSGQAYRRLKRWQFKEGYQAEYIAGIILFHAFLVGFGLCLRLLLLEFYDTKPLVAILAPGFALACLPIMFEYYSYVYDFPVLIFITLGMIFIHRRNMTLFWTTYILGLFNKETMILLPLVFWLQYRKDETLKKWRRRNLAAMIIVFIFIRQLLLALFQQNPGGGFAFPLFSHNIFFLWTQDYDYTHYVSMAMLVLAVFYRWEEKPVFLKRALFMAVPLLFLTMLMGFLDEFRDYYEVYPVVFLLIAQTLCFILRIPFVPRRPKA